MNAASRIIAEALDDLEREPDHPEKLARGRAKQTLTKAADGIRIGAANVLGDWLNRADALMGCLEGSAEEAELAMLTDVIKAYERQRWPLGRMPGGKG